MAIILNLPDAVVHLPVSRFHLLQLKVATW
jgi:hypothetical protein